jgi:hypothetical protein
MPLSASIRKQLLLLRQHVRRLLVCPPGCAKGAMEAHTMRVCRCLRKAMGEVDFAAVTDVALPAWITSEVVGKAWDGEAVGPPAAPPIVVQVLVDRKHLNARGAEEWGRLHKDLIKDQLEKLAKRRCYAKWPIPKLRKHIIWIRWQALPAAEKRLHCDAVAHGRHQRARDSSGIWRFVADVPVPSAATMADDAPLSDLLIATPLAGEPTPSASSSPGPRTPTKKFYGHLGRAMMEMLNSGTTPEKLMLHHVQKLAVVATRKAGLSFTRAKQLFHKHALSVRSWKASKTSVAKPKAARGRKRGVRVVDDDRLKRLLEPVTQPSCVWSRKQKSTIRTLKGSLRMCHMQDEQLRSTISYRHLARRTRRVALRMLSCIIIH